MEVVEESSPRNSYLGEPESFDEGEGDHLIHGVAMGEGDITRSQSGAELYWSADALRMAANTLEGRPLVVDHEDSAYAVVGEVMEANFKENVGIVYKARLTDEELAEKIQDDLLEVSIKVYRPDDEKLEEREDGVLVVDRAKIDNLSVVARGEAPSNYVEYGESDDFSEEECLELLSVEEEDEQDETFDEIVSAVADELEASEERILEAIESLEEEESESDSVSEGEKEQPSEESEAPNEDEADSILADVLNV